MSKYKANHNRKGKPMKFKERDFRLGAEVKFRQPGGKIGIGHVADESLDCAVVVVFVDRLDTHVYVPIENVISVSKN